MFQTYGPGLLKLSGEEMPCSDVASGWLQDHPEIAILPFVKTQTYSESVWMTTLAHLNGCFIADLTHDLWMKETRDRLNPA
jgi:hypothetical protein